MPINKQGKSKWQDASNTVNKIRYDLSDLLRTFDESERQTQNYKDLVNDILRNACRSVRDVTPQYADNCDEEHGSEDSDKINWKSKKLWGMILASPILVEGLKYIPDLIQLIKGTPQ
jgi:hypothetical protein